MGKPERTRGENGLDEYGIIYKNYSRIKERKELETFLLRDVDTWLTPEEALQWGLADIAEPSRRHN